MTELYDKFCDYLITKKKTSENTLSSYKRDIKSFMIFLQSKKISDVRNVNGSTVELFVKHLKKAGKSDSTILRNISSLRCFFKYLVLSKVIDFNPTVGIKNDNKKSALLPKIMSAKDIDILLNSPDCKTGKGKRDKAMLEVMYATGIRVSELLSIKTSDVNLEIGYIIISKGTTKERAIPLYPIAISALNDYIVNERKYLVKNKTDCNYLFLNSNGYEMTRQGFWKIIKQYALGCNIDADITPKILRHSFATHLLENGADIHVIKDMLGHSTISSTKVYTKVLKNKYLSIYENCHPRAKQL